MGKLSEFALAFSVVSLMVSVIALMLRLARLGVI